MPTFLKGPRGFPKGVLWSSDLKLPYLGSRIQLLLTHSFNTYLFNDLLCGALAMLWWATLTHSLMTKNE